VEGDWTAEREEAEREEEEITGVDGGDTIATRYSAN